MRSQEEKLNSTPSFTIEDFKTVSETVALTIEESVPCKNGEKPTLSIAIALKASYFAICLGIAASLLGADITDVILFAIASDLAASALNALATTLI